MGWHKKHCFLIRKQRTKELGHLVQGHKLKWVGLIFGASPALKPSALPSGLENRGGLNNFWGHLNWASWGSREARGVSRRRPETSKSGSSGASAYGSECCPSFWFLRETENMEISWYLSNLKIFIKLRVERKHCAGPSWARLIYPRGPSVKPVISHYSAGGRHPSVTIPGSGTWAFGEAFPATRCGAFYDGMWLHCWHLSALGLLILSACVLLISCNYSWFHRASSTFQESILFFFLIIPTSNLLYMLHIDCLSTINPKAWFSQPL